MLSDNDRDGKGERGKTRVTRTASQHPGQEAASPGGVIPTGASSIQDKKTPVTLTGNGDPLLEEISWLQTSRTMLISR